MSKEEQLGSTSNFPDGKLNENDEGELKLSIGIYKGNVMVNFGKPVHWLGLPPDQAIQFGHYIIEKANYIKDK